MGWQRKDDGSYDWPEQGAKLTRDKRSRHWYLEKDGERIPLGKRATFDTAERQLARRTRAVETIARAQKTASTKERKAKLSPRMIERMTHEAYYDEMADRPHSSGNREEPTRVALIRAGLIEEHDIKGSSSSTRLTDRGRAVVEKLRAEGKLPSREAVHEQIRSFGRQVKESGGDEPMAKKVSAKQLKAIQEQAKERDRAIKAKDEKPARKFAGAGEAMGAAEARRQHDWGTPTEENRRKGEHFSAEREMRKVSIRELNHEIDSDQAYEEIGKIKDKYKLSVEESEAIYDQADFKARRSLGMTSPGEKPPSAKVSPLGTPESKDGQRDQKRASEIQAKMRDGKASKADMDEHQEIVKRIIARQWGETEEEAAEAMAGSKPKSVEAPGKKDDQYYEARSYAERAMDEMDSSATKEDIAKEAKRLAKEDGVTLRDSDVKKHSADLHADLQADLDDDYGDDDEDQPPTEEEKAKKKYARDLEEEDMKKAAVDAAYRKTDEAARGGSREKKMKAFADESGARPALDKDTAKKIAKEGGIKSIETGPRGGVYYITKSGKKIYTKRGK